ncbi:hypothetical protein ACFO3O_16425 [Dokdonia ponticola]|uniref:Uncharacterized protein n=1 Tax=Dokdonia ponticola TaxID=2041041 RepID=A0ABV9HZA7_9FLAO
MKILFTISFLGLLFLEFHFSETQVYLCNSSGAKKYHYKKNCRGLSNCKKEIKKVSLETAQERGRTLCGWED